MALPYYLDTTESLKGLIKDQGGDFHTDPPNQTYPSYSSTYMSASRAPANYHPFVLSLFNVESGEARYPLSLMINPTDIQYGNSQAIQNAYMRKGWVSTYWGNQLRTLTVSGSTAGFYYNPNEVQNTARGLQVRAGGLSNYNRRNSLAFANLLALIALYKRNGAYFLRDTADQTLWNDGTSRVINVMDFVMVSYDGTDHLGGFNSFTIDDKASTPYRVLYNFEFVVAGVRGDTFDGHLRKGDNDRAGSVQVSIQGEDMELTKTLRMNEEELNDYYKMSAIPQFSSTEYSYDELERLDELNLSLDEPWGNDKRGYYIDSKGVNRPVAVVPDNTTKVTRGGLDEEDHGGKIDYRTGTGQIRALSDGRVISTALAGDGEYYVLTRTKVNYNGVMVDAYVRYYHMDPLSISGLTAGSTIGAGTFLGSERYTGSDYPPHCDLEVRIIDPANPGYSAAFRIDATNYFNQGTKTLGAMATYPDGGQQKDYGTIVYKHGEKGTP